MLQRDWPADPEEGAPAGPEVRASIERYVAELADVSFARLRDAADAGVEDPVALVLDPAHPAARAIAEAAATPAAVAAAIGAARRRGMTSPRLTYILPRPLIAALLAAGYPGTAAEVAARTGPGLVLVGRTALSCFVDR